MKEDEIKKVIEKAIKKFGTYGEGFINYIENSTDLHYLSSDDNFYRTMEGVFSDWYFLQDLGFGNLKLIRITLKHYDDDIVFYDYEAKRCGIEELFRTCEEVEEDGK